MRAGKGTSDNLDGNGALTARRPFAALRRPRRVAVVLVVALALAGGATLKLATAGGAVPIEHVVVILQENHSFDNVLGRLCIQDKRENCHASETGENEKGETIKLSKASDKVVGVAHDQKSQLKAMNGGKMNGWENIQGCSAKQCYTAYEPSQIPSLAKLAREGAISDAFYSRDIVPSWGAHLDFFAQTLDGFVGENPTKGKHAAGPGWGCDSFLESPWFDPKKHKNVKEPSCIPNEKGEGPFRTSPVAYTRTIADQLEKAGKTWGIYGATNPSEKQQVGPYKWAICPTFAECLYGKQKEFMHEAPQFMSVAKEGKLPNFSIVTPSVDSEGETSQHNGTSMLVGDNYIGKTVAAIEEGADAASTTIFIYYDDCGCFYDHVPPPAGLGIRLPLVIVSPYAKAGYTDNETATDSSILAYTETVLHVEPVSEEDEKAYNFHNSFTSVATPVKFSFSSAPVPSSSLGLTEPPGEDT
jgi:phospholipase C